MLKIATPLHALWIKRFILFFFFVGRDSAGGVVTRYGLDGPWIELRWELDFPNLSILALGPTQTPVQWVMGLFPGCKAARVWLWPTTPI